MYQTGVLRLLPGAFKRYVWSKRVGDFAVLAAIPLFGFLYGVYELNAFAVSSGIWLSIISILLMIHIFSLNDWADYLDDRPHRTPRPLNQFERGERLSFLIVALSSALLLFPSLWLMRPAATVPAGATVLCSALYSCRWRMHGKETMLLSSLLHFVCGASCFIMGLTVASGSGTEWTGISIFLGLSIAAGHINQEISDHREDRVSGIRTYSTVLGPTVAFAIGQVIFAAAFLSLLVGIPSEHASFFAPVVILLSLLNVTLAIGCCWKQVDPKSVERYRFNYRVLYLLVGLCLLLRAPLFHQ